ncbi:MAG TPA: response regulator [Thermoanaerobaculia bacterium]
MADEPIIWIVDDDPSVRRSLVRLVRSAGIRACEFASAREFLDASPAGRGCVLLDLHMPEINGIELLEQLAGSARRYPVILLSANADLGTIASAITCGAVGFLVKPVEDEELLGSIRVAIDSIRSEVAP